ncbi:MAG TPA: ATP-dependent sacrificial sulfur transferase LarE [Verrucomicrobiales bacterium]|nr:ATP-dependent sacrificial sulfur transferase LarE [Verrucomicrobiae bacterium]HAO65501.1 ATP-dependent sacrificial sulfur transferase LarE [Verrucomicrobiales bacterium]HAQ99232.1 ATP-dependent sacrificial sulfur transferase LarE [Verrucomicrobiales bacterium]HBP55351.1 ATP-dependent sacrificial sulfur transferase LarE [Verrucomicrobiales bacterium]|tara:strand:+ start:1619 stop:2452 length:834 start_codon:yes stop_codon:yes gene_type:complete
MDKLQQLENLLNQLGSCLVAYSGGVDSAFLALVAYRTLGDQSLAVMADSPSLPRSEFKEAIALSEQFGFPLKIIQTKEFENEEYLSNPNNRCYFCKHALFEETESLAMERGVSAVLYGEIADDIGDFRPGAQAAKEFQVRAPMKEVGLTKSEIRVYSSEMGLPTASKPQMACLSSRIPYGEKVTVKKLSQIEEAEALLRKLGFHDIRVRHHELSQGALARIEIGSVELDQLVQPAIRETLTQSIKSLGYLYVTLDLMGYQRGSLNSARQASNPQPLS